MSADTWHHFAGIRQGNTISIYVDGVLRQTKTSTSASLNVDNNQPLIFGDHTWGPNFPGQVDEVSLYNRVLTPTEIQAIYNAGAAGKCPPATPAPIGLVEWWTADDNALGVRNRNDGVLQNGANFISGKVGQAFNFDGSNDYFSASSAPEINFGTGDFSVEYWIKINGAQLSAGREYGLINKNTTYQGNPGWGFELSTEFGNFPNPRIDFFNTISIWNSTNVRATITTGVWHHVVGLRENGVNKLYLDGVLAQTNANTNVAANVDNTQPLLVGSWLGTYFPGQLDEISLYHRALTPAEIQSIYNAGTAGKSKPTATVSPSNQVLWLAGDGGATDLSGSGNHGTPQNGAGNAVGKVGQAFSFNGFNNYVSIPHNSAQDIRQAITIESWIMKKGDCSGFGAGGNCVVMAKQIASGNTEANLRYGLLVVDTGGANQGKFLLSFNTGTWDDIVLSNTIAQNDVWYHVAGTYDGSSAKIYVNGVLEASAAKTGEILPSASGTLEIGRQSGIGEEYFNGLIDEASLYNRALTQDEISSIYNAGLAGKLKQTTTGGTTATVGDVSLTFSDAATRTVQEIPLDETDFPALPSGMTSTGLFYDIATDSPPSGTTSLCFNLPSFAALTLSEFSERRILHLENGAWNSNLPTTHNFAAKTICANVSSFSPFAIVDSNLAPTAANLSISGRITGVKGNAIARVSISITDTNGVTRIVQTNTFGYYRFDELEAGETYILSAIHKRYQFTPSTQIVSLKDATDDVNFTAIE